MDKQTAEQLDKILVSLKEGEWSQYFHDILKLDYNRDKNRLNELKGILKQNDHIQDHTTKDFNGSPAGSITDNGLAFLSQGGYKKLVQQSKMENNIVDRFLKRVKSHKVTATFIILGIVFISVVTVFEKGSFLYSCWRHNNEPIPPIKGETIVKQIPALPISIDTNVLRSENKGSSKIKTRWYIRQGESHLDSLTGVSTGIVDITVSNEVKILLYIPKKMKKTILCNAGEFWNFTYENRKFKLIITKIEFGFGCTFDLIEM